MDAYAAVEDEGIIIDTIGSTERAAMVNWLATRSGYMPVRSDDDERIRALFEQTGRARVERVTVKIA